MGVVGNVGQHYDENHYRWQTTDVPGFFVISSKEQTLASKPLFQSFYTHMQLIHQVDLKPDTERKVTDGGPAINAAADEVLPEKPHLLCLQHSKKNVGKYVKWKHGNMTKTVNGWQENTAWWPDHIFTVAWRRLYQVLRGVGLDENVSTRSEGQAEANAIDYMNKSQVTGDDANGYTARWKYSYQDTDPGKSTYAPNSVESLHAVVNQMSVDEHGEERTIEKFFDQCEDTFRLWHQEKRWTEAQGFTDSPIG